MYKPRVRMAVIDWTMEPMVQFKTPERRLSKDLLAQLDTLSLESEKHPIIEWLDVFQNPKAAFRRAFVPIRRASNGPIYRRQSNEFCASEAIEGLILKFQGYLNEFQLNVVVRTDMAGTLGLRLQCPDNKKRSEFRLLAALLAVAENGDISRVRRCLVCKRWLYARQCNQYFDSRSCYDKAWQHIPAVKEKRNRDRVRRYHEEKERDRRALERVRK